MQLPFIPRTVSRQGLLYGCGYIAVLALYNIVAYLVDGMLQWVAIVVLLCFTALFIRRFSLRAADLGVQTSTMLRGLLVGLSISAGIAVIMVLLYAIHPSFFTDTRYSTTTTSQAVGRLLYMLVHTVLIEELVFRGVLLGIFMRLMHVKKAVIASSLLFGLWHIVPSLNVYATSSAANALIPAFIGTVAVVAGIVVATGFAGVLFSIARVRSGSLLAPVLVHWTINGVGLVLAILSVA